MARLRDVMRKDKTAPKGTKAHRMDRKRSEIMLIKKAKSEPGKARVSKVREGLKKIRSM